MWFLSPFLKISKYCRHEQVFTRSRASFAETCNLSILILKPASCRHSGQRNTNFVLVVLWLRWSIMPLSRQTKQARISSWLCRNGSIRRNHLMLKPSTKALNVFLRSLKMCSPGLIEQTGLYNDQFEILEESENLANFPWTEYFIFNHCFGCLSLLPLSVMIMSIQFII